MITFLASPKPFKGIAKEHQHRAIQNWLAAADGAEVILYGDSAGIDEAGDKFGVRVQKQIDGTPSGIPYFGAIAEHAAEHAKHNLQVYLNCDILLNGIQEAITQIPFDQFLLIGQRIDLGEDVVVDPSQDDWIECLKNLSAIGKIRMHAPTGIDYFGFRRGMWRDLPTIIIGRCGYDNALLAYCMRNRIAIVDGTFAVTALHQFHDYGHVEGGQKTVARGSDAMHNIRQAGGLRGATMVSDAGYVLDNSRILHRPCRGDRLRRLELKVRYELGWPNVALGLRLIWRGLRAVGITRVPQPTLAEVIDAQRLFNNVFPR
jgi:hypothetical protein